MLRIPDWSVVVARAEGELPGGVPVATTHLHRIVACDEAARERGVRVGQRVRDAQAGAPDLVLADADEVGELLAFAHVLRAVEGVVPLTQGLEAGALAFPVRGAARFYGSEEAAVEAIRASLAAIGSPLVGIADDRFAAEVAGRAASVDEPLRIVPQGGSAAFLSPQPVAHLGGELPSMLARLGIHTLGAFAALGDAHVRDRFGAAGVRDLWRARGHDDRGVAPDAQHPPEALVLEFEPGIEGAEELALAMRERADAYVRDLAGRRLVCAEVRILLRADLGGMAERVWRKPGFFRGADLVDRARWQLAESGLDSALVEVRITPERLDDETRHMPGLWGGGGVDDRTRGVIERLQGVLGREGVVTAHLGGGRLLAERGVLTPWGDAAPVTREGPWPGALPEPRPTTVFRPPVPVRLLDADGASVAVSERIPQPVWLQGPVGERRRVRDWAGPWPLRMRAGATYASLARLQVIDGAGEAWVLLGDDAGWRAEGRYD